MTLAHHLTDDGRDGKKQGFAHNKLPRAYFFSYNEKNTIIFLQNPPFILQIYSPFGYNIMRRSVMNLLVDFITQRKGRVMVVCSGNCQLSIV